MPDWTKSMSRSYEFYIVDPASWKDIKRLDTVKSCTISRDSMAETLGSASIDISESVGECYIRAYLITIQNEIKEKHPLGTFLVQTPSSSFNGKIRDVTMDAYTPLLELKENLPPIGFYLSGIENPKIKVLDKAYELTKNYQRAPVVKSSSDHVVDIDVIPDPQDTWLSFITDVLAIGKYKFALDSMSRILFEPERNTASLQPVWTYNDDNSSILYPDITLNHDLYGIPNRLEVVYTTSLGDISCVATNENPNSLTSRQQRGRWITTRESDPQIMGVGSDTNIETLKPRLEEYTKQRLKELSTVEYTVTYTHGYCPVRLGDCVRLNYSRAGINNVKAKVIKQSIKCDTSCSVTETAVFTTSLWGGDDE